jgi:hypothetical protein
MSAPCPQPGRKVRKALGPYSRVLRRGVIADYIDGRSTLGRFIRDLERQLTQHVGGDPSITQKLLIERLIKIRVQLDLLDKKLARGEWTHLDGRTYAALLNAHRLTARELGLLPVKPKQPSLAEHFAARAAPGSDVV